MPGNRSGGCGRRTCVRPLRHLAAVLALLVATVAAALGLLAATAPPASACSCAIRGMSDFADTADAVFTGAPVERFGQEDVGSDVRYTFRVDAVYGGQVPGTATVTTGSQSSACGLPGLELDERYVVYASESRGGQYSISLCGGTRQVSEPYVERLADRVGDPRPPADDVTTPADDRDAAAGAPPRDGGGMGDRTLPMALVAGGAGAVIVGALMVGAWRVGRGQGRGAVLR